MNALGRSLETPQLRPTVMRSIVFRFAFTYWGLYCFLVLCVNTFNFTTPISNAFGAFGVWVGKAILGITYELSGAENGSGDKTSDWVLLLCIASTALVATVVWSLLDRRRTDSPRLREGIRIVVRYTLAFSVMGYGISKVFFGQFPLPYPGRLLQRFGDASPMGLMWTFMGASPAYVFFAGALETIGAGLLLSRRTATLGALVLSGVMLNVAMMNLCYDVPVKLCSLHYFAMAVFLLLPDARRLANVLVFNRVAPPVGRDLVLPRRWMRVTRVAVKYIAIAVVVFLHGKDAITLYGERAESQTSNAWYEGYWTVASFRSDGRDVPDSTREPMRWTRISFRTSDSKVLVRWRLTGSGYGDRYVAVIDESARTMKLTLDPESSATKQPEPGLRLVTLTYVRSDDNHLVMEGRLGANDIVVQLERVDTSNMLLLTRGFHWINEVPFNR